MPENTDKAVCKVHPRYTGSRKPTSKDEHCTCQSIYEEQKTKRESLGISTRDVFKYVAYYTEKIRDCGKPQGIYKQIVKMLTDGEVTEREIQTALKHYAEDEFRKNGDIKFTKHIRSFFVPFVILEWQTPRTKKQRSAREDAGMSTLRNISDVAHQVSRPALPSHFRRFDDSEDDAHASV